MKRGDYVLIPAPGTLCIGINNTRMSVFMEGPTGTIRIYQGSDIDFISADKIITESEMRNIYGSKALPIWVNAIRASATQPPLPGGSPHMRPFGLPIQLPQSGGPPIAGQPVGYPIGTVLHDKNALIGNLWIVTVDNSYDASMLYDGKLKICAPDIYYKQDTMAPNMRIATPPEIKQILGINSMPAWASWFYVGSWYGATATIRSRLINRIAKDLGMEKAEKPKSDSNETSCFHKYQVYHGLNHSFEFCTICDHKKDLIK